MTEFALQLQALVRVDGQDCALLTIENDLTGTDEKPNYVVMLDLYREKRTVRASIKEYDRADKTRLDLLTEAFRAIAAVER